MSEINVQRRTKAVTRLFAAAILAAAMGTGVSGCSPGADYPTLFPAVHDMPPPRAETPMDADQVQQATEDLITQRNHLSAEAQGAGQAKDGAAPAPSANPQPAKKSQSTAASTKANGASGATPGLAASGTQTAGAESK